MVKQSNGDGVWWLPVVTGIALVLFGIAALFWPGMTLVTFVVLFSVYVVVMGAIELVRGFMQLSRGDKSWWISLLLGVLALGVGVYLARHPGVTFATLILLLGFMFLIQGVMDVIRGLFGDNPSATSRTLAFVAGILGIIAGIFVLNQPADAGVTFVWIVGLYALILGPVMIAMASDAKRAIDG